MSAPPDRLLAGVVGKPHGLRGEVYVEPISDDPRRFDAGSELQRGDGDVLVVAGARVHRNRLLVKFEGVDDRDAAETLRGPLYVSGDDLRPLGDGEFWTFELAGCEVVTSAGERVGEVARVVPGAANDLLEVTTASGDALVPMVKEIVVAIDVDARRVTVDPPAGLID